MKTEDAILPGCFMDGEIPPNVALGPNTIIKGADVFRRYQSTELQAVRTGSYCLLDDVHLAVGKNGKLVIGDYCYFTGAILLCELNVQIGSYVIIGCSVTITDSDFHPLEPAQRIADLLAMAPGHEGRRRPSILCKPVTIEDEVWVGPKATILKGVHVGRGAFIEPGAMVTRDVPAGARVTGNPAQIIGTA